MFTDPQTPPPTETDANGAPVRKFMFERSFEAAAIIQRAAERKPVLMKPEQIDALRKESFDSGFEAGRTAGKDEQTDRLTKMMQIINQNMTRLIENLAAINREQDVHARQLVLAVAKKVLPDFAARNGLAEIDALLADTIREMAREPRLVVRIHEDQFDAINQRVQEIATQRAYPGKVIVLADPEVLPGDCRVEWADGGVERNAQATWRAVEQTIYPQ